MASSTSFLPIRPEMQVLWLSGNTFDLNGVVFPDITMEQNQSLLQD